MDQHKTADSARRLSAVILAANEIGRPIIATPGIPADRVKILRDAFMKTMNDPELWMTLRRKNSSSTLFPAKTWKVSAKRSSPNRRTSSNG